MPPLFKIGQEVQANDTYLIEYLLGRNLGTTGIVKDITKSSSAFKQVPYIYHIKFEGHSGVISIEEGNIQAVSNTFNSQAEVWEYLLSGGKVQGNYTKNIYQFKEGYITCISKEVTVDMLSFKDYRDFAKYTEPAKWYDNIPKSGILCLTTQIEGGRESINIIHSYEDKGCYKFRTKRGGFRHARPATLEEGNKLIYQQEPEYRVGDYFTVVESIGFNDNSWRGDCFEVIVVDGQFIRAKNHSKGWAKGDLITIDMEKFKVRPVSSDYASSFIKSK